DGRDEERDGGRQSADRAGPAGAAGLSGRPRRSPAPGAVAGLHGLRSGLPDRGRHPEHAGPGRAGGL
ncbi:MAG: hypothetical protein AVDCRST_MAG49-4287, partial [uncultured Thermomicrobiales bacterium]